MDDITQANAPSFQLGFRATAILLAYGLSLFLIGLGSNRVLTFHETCVAVPAKEMLASGNYITTTYAGVNFNHKPPIGHWLVAATMSVFHSDSEFVVRMPFALIAVATALILASMAARWHGEFVGLLAGLIQLTMYYSQMQGRLAEVDIVACFFVTLAIAAFARVLLDGSISHAVSSSSGWHWKGSMLFYFAAGCAFLTKGPLSVGMAIGPCILLGCILMVKRVFGRSLERSQTGIRQRIGASPTLTASILRLMFNPAGLIVLLVLLFAWPVAAYQRLPGILNTWVEHNFQRFAGKYSGGDKPPFYYLYNLPMMLFPWTIFVGYGIWFGWKKRFFHDVRWQLLALWFALGFAVLCASAWQHKHYMIPVLPMFSIFGAVGFDQILQKVRNKNTTLERKTKFRLALLMEPSIAFGLVWLVSVGVEVWVMPHFDSYRDQVIFAQRINQTLNSEERIEMLELPVSQIAYYLDMPIERIDHAERFVEKIGAGTSPSYLILAPQYVVEKFRDIGDVEILDRCETIRHIMTESERLTLAKFSPDRLRFVTADDTKPILYR